MNGKRIFLSALAAFLCTLAASSAAEPWTGPYGLSLEPAPPLEAAGRPRDRPFRDRSPSHPQFFLDHRLRETPQGSVANEVAFQAPASRAPAPERRSQDQDASSRIPSSSTVTLPAASVAGRRFPRRPPARLSAAATDPPSFSLTGAPCTPRPSGRAEDTLNLKLRVRADWMERPGYSWCPTEAKRAGAPWRPSGQRRLPLDGAQVQGADAPADTGSSFRPTGRKHYCSIRETSLCPLPRAAASALLPPATSSDPGPKKSGRALPPRISSPRSTDSPRRGNDKGAFSALVSGQRQPSAEQAPRAAGAFSVRPCVSSLQPRMPRPHPSESRPPPWSFCHPARD
jgi:hypothetical protein